MDEQKLRGRAKYRIARIEWNGARRHKAHNPFDNLLREGDDRVVTYVVAGSPISVRQGGPVVAANGRCGGVDSSRCQQTMSSSKTLDENTMGSSL